MQRPSLVFVHGTGGRQEAYAETLRQIQEVLDQRSLNVKLVPCLWGTLGANLNADGASIPTYINAQGGQALSPEEEEIRFWSALYNDPFYEMRLLGLRPLQEEDLIPGKSTPAQELEERVAALAESTKLRKKLHNLGIDQIFEEAFEKIVGPDSRSYRRLLETASSDLSEDYVVIARAIVAASRELCKNQGIYPWLLVNDTLRDKAIQAIQETLNDGEKAMGLGDFVKELMVDVVLDIGTNHIKRKRRATMDGAYPFAGDILVYQAKGRGIREFIRNQVLNKNVEPPVFLLAHSLGGIACVDLLIEEDLREKVDGLITVGSQAPFFYEIGALQTLSYGEPLPEHFPEKWLNVYDLRDFLSYIGDHEKLFAGRIKDVQVNNRQPFPEAHSAYWANEETWNAITEFLR